MICRDHRPGFADGSQLKPGDSTPNAFEATLQRPLVAYQAFVERRAYFYESRSSPRRIEKKTKITHYPFARTLTVFYCSTRPSIHAQKIRDPAGRRWIAYGESLLILGHPGMSKTHLSVALGSQSQPKTDAIQELLTASYQPHSANKLVPRAEFTMNTYTKNFPWPPPRETDFFTGQLFKEVSNQMKKHSLKTLITTSIF